MSLNPEPTQPEEREAQHLAPKSYAEAAEEGASPHSHTNGLDGMKEINAESVLTNGSIRPSIPQEPDKEQYEGSGQDNTPRSPIRKGHKRNSSSKSNGSKKAKKDERSNSQMYEQYKDGDGVLLTSMKPSDNYEKELRQDKKETKKKDQLVPGRMAGAGWQRSSIRFAPLNVPLQRRLQTLVVLMHTLSIALTLTTFFFLCSIPIFWPILLPYLIYVLFSHAGTSGQLSHRSERFRRSSIWSLFASYFPARLHRSHVLPPTRKYIFGYHPHGIISHGAFAAFATEALGFSQLFPGITNTLLTLDSNFRIPLYREYALRMGLASVSRESCENILSKGGPNGEGMGRAITIVIGGARESLDARPGAMRLVLGRRKGFVKLAIRTGADLVPVLAFGENELYEQVNATEHPRVHRLQLLVKKLMGFTVPLFHARGVFNYDVGMMPYRKSLNVVVGRPIKLIQKTHPGKDYVDNVHAEYVKELTRIWDEWKDTFAKDRKGELEIIE
ncbi:diacylglycerol O-acyltransferase 2A [Cenococcum geophilum 1.58]|uniref:diacylglycerol O-acyltransferase 2A n=1 Tax=Cenococcum geophilum 1.58 TaxID=794803 RepID=UPI00358FF07D|nr:diacylglycerol O-acyltransferase 2A [Cenococcum geophilum 1.58]